jgi:hypothetical protein
MSARTALTAALSALALLSCVGDAGAQFPQAPASSPWFTRPGDWGKKGIILLPPNKETGSTLPVMVYPNSKPAPVARPNHLQFQRFDSQGRPVFVNPATGRSTTGNATGLIGAPVPLSEVKRMNAARPLGQSAPVAPVRRRP